MLVVSCSTKYKEHEGDETNDAEWPEMDSFHMVMAETFHPYKDSSNLQPIKDHAEELKQAAIKWASSSLPERINNENVKESLVELKTKASALAE
jgi:hypothetical protein